MRPTFHALKVSDKSTPQLGRLYPFIKKAVSHMQIYDQEMYDRSYKVRWQVSNDGTPVVASTEAHFRETPVLEAAYCVDPFFLDSQCNETSLNKQQK